MISITIAMVIIARLILKGAMRLVDIEVNPIWEQGTYMHTETSWHKGNPFEGKLPAELSCVRTAKSVFLLIYVLIKHPLPILYLYHGPVKHYLIQGN